MVLKHFSGLVSITVTTPGLGSEFGHERFESPAYLRSIICAIDEAEFLKLKKLVCVEVAGLTFFDMDGQEVKLCESGLRKVSRMHWKFAEDIEGDPNQTADLDRRISCIRGLFEVAPLEDLTLYSNSSCHEFIRIPFEYIMTEGYIWPKLSALRLSSLIISESHFTAFLARHTKLRHVTLMGDMSLENGKWDGIFEALKSLNLESCSLKGMNVDGQGPMFKTWSENLSLRIGYAPLVEGYFSVAEGYILEGLSNEKKYGYGGVS